ncbi:MAG: hypothetical protein J5717_12025 [Lachnospiraceae bacterium]|nr:hypothetical protein [Lachnospiraceae bacterium]
MITKRTSMIRLMVCLAAFVIIYLYALLTGDNLRGLFGWLVFLWLLMFAEWTAFVWLREHIGRHCYWVIPSFVILYYWVGVMIVDSIPGWSGLGAAIFFLLTLAVLAGAVVFFFIEMIIYRVYKKKN